MTKNFDEVAQQMIEEHRDLFDDLANCIRCPGCGEKVRKPFYNLGPKFHSFEGCKACADLHNPEGKT